MDNKAYTFRDIKYDRNELTTKFSRIYEYKSTFQEHERKCYVMTDEVKKFEQHKYTHFSHNVTKYGIFKKYQEPTIFTSNILLYLDLLPAIIRNDMINLFKLFNISNYEYATELMSFLSCISEIAKLHGSAFSDHWRFYHGLHQMFYYFDLVPQSSIVDSIKEWLCEEVELTIDGSEDKWHEYFSDAINHICDNEFSNYEAGNPLSTYEYLHTYKWLKGKGTNTRASNIYDKRKNKIRATRRSKQSSSFNMDLGVLQNQLFTITPQVLRPFQKPEVGKIRKIISGDFDNFLKMDYLSHFFEKGFRNHPHMVIFQDRKHRLDLAYNMISRGKNLKYIKIPLDQAKFDHTVTRRMLITIFSKFEDMLPKNSEMHKVMQYLTCSMFSKQSKIYTDSGIFNYVKGVASGWRWTALLDTLISYAEFLVCTRVYNERAVANNQSQLNIIESEFQGDDVRMVIDNTPAEAYTLMGIYGECGIKVHKQKNFIAYDRDEFLKMVADGDELVGYPARTIPSLTQYKPLSNAPLNFRDRMNDHANNVIRAIRRGLSLEPCLDHLVRLAKDEVCVSTYCNWLITPATMGGYGLIDPVVIDYLSKYINKREYVTLEPTLIKYENKLSEPRFEETVRQVKRHYEIDDEVLANNIVSMLPYADRGIKLVKRCELKQIDRVYDAKKPEGYVYDHAPRWKELFTHPAIVESIKSTSIRDHSNLHKVLTPISYAHYELLKHLNVTKSVINLWLQSNIQVVYPKSIYYDPVMYMELDTHFVRLLTKSIFHRNATMTDFYSAQLYLERRSYEDMLSILCKKSPIKG